MVICDISPTGNGPPNINGFTLQTSDMSGLSLPLCYSVSAVFKVSGQAAKSRTNRAC